MIAAAVALLAAGCGGDSSIVDPKGSEAHTHRGRVVADVRAGGRGVRRSSPASSCTRRRAAGAAATSRRRSRDNAFIWIGGVFVPVLILVVLAVVTVSTTSALRKPAHDELRIDVVGKRWWWRVSYPGERIATANEIHLPAGQPVEIRLDLRQRDPQLLGPAARGQGRHDPRPAQRPALHRRTTSARTSGQCAEFCGIQHTHMSIRVIVQTPPTSTAGSPASSGRPVEPASESAASGQVVFQREACAGCHTIAAPTRTGTVGPNLTDVGARTTLGAGAIENTPANLRTVDPRRAGGEAGRARCRRSTSLSDRDVADIVAYLESLK